MSFKVQTYLPALKALAVRLFVVPLMLAFGLSASGQSLEGKDGVCDTTVWFVNIYPGGEIYELEGHSALRIKTCDMDVAINYGMFSFSQPNFVYRFVKGETDYMVGAIPWPYFIGEYTAQGRRVAAHEIDLTSAEKARLLSLISENLKPCNRTYRYNYVLDNCATRPLAMLEKSVGDSLVLESPSTEPDLGTFREYMRYYHRNYPWYQFGIDLALGNGIDRPITDREKSFAPVVLDDQMPKVRVGNIGGRSLVKTSEIWNDAKPEAAVLSATPWYATPLFMCTLLAIIIIVYVAGKVIRRKMYPRIVATIFFAIYGIAGLLVAFLVFVSVHEATSPNVNLLWLNPLCLIPCVTLWIKKCKKANCWYFLFNFVLLIVVLVLWAFGYQSPNLAFIPLLLIDLTLTLSYLYLQNIKIEKSHKK